MTPVDKDTPKGTRCVYMNRGSERWYGVRAEFVRKSQGKSLGIFRLLQTVAVTRCDSPVTYTIGQEVVFMLADMRVCPEHIVTETKTVKQSRRFTYISHRESA